MPSRNSPDLDVKLYADNLNELTYLTDNMIKKLHHINKLIENGSQECRKCGQMIGGVRNRMEKQKRERANYY